MTEVLPWTTTADVYRVFPVFILGPSNTIASIILLLPKGAIPKNCYTEAGAGTAIQKLYQFCTFICKTLV